MRIDVSRLGAEAQRQVLSKMLVVKARESKYGSRKDVRMMPNGELRRFDSQKEARRYDELTARLRAGMIRDLRLQHTFTLQEGYVNSDGDAVRAITYKADFTYWEMPAFWRGYEEQCPADRWNFVVEDVKGVRTEAYKIKKKLIEERGWRVREI